MSYANKEFWKRYAAYLYEVQWRHALALQALVPAPIRRNVLDLGCGQCAEALTHFRERLGIDFYRGIDLDPARTSDTHMIVGDYRDPSLLKLVRDSNERARFNSIVSFFSTELTASFEENDLFYAALFDLFPSVDEIVVSGFYYDDLRSRDEVVHEVGGLKSYQSNGPISRRLDELRVLLRVPSELFGPNVVEVWRRLRRLPEKEGGHK